MILLIVLEIYVGCSSWGDVVSWILLIQFSFILVLYVFVLTFFLVIYLVPVWRGKTKILQEYKANSSLTCMRWKYLKFVPWFWTGLLRRWSWSLWVMTSKYQLYLSFCCELCFNFEGKVKLPGRLVLILFGWLGDWKVRARLLHDHNILCYLDSGAEIRYG